METTESKWVNMVLFFFIRNGISWNPRDDPQLYIDVRHRYQKRSIP
jgi:hypothetical protein